MGETTTLFIVSIIATLPVALSIGILKTKNKEAIHYAFLCLMFFLFIWNIGMVLELSYKITNGSYSFEIVKLGFFGLTFFPVVLLYTALVFMGKKVKLLAFMPFFAVPVLTNIIIFTNNNHHLFYRIYSPDSKEAVYGPYLYVHIFYCYACLLAAFIIFLYVSVKKSGIVSRQALSILIGGVIPFIVNILVSLQLIHATRYVTHVFLSISAICLWVATFKFDFLNLVPMARKIIINGISDSFLVLDTKANVIDYNESFLKKFVSNNAGSIYRLNMENLIPKSVLHEFEQEKNKKIMEALKNHSAPFQFEYYFSSLKSYYIIEINPIIKNSQFRGSIIILKDITRYRALMDEIEHLTIKHERDRMKENLHDILGHGLYGLLRLIELCYVKIDENTDEVKEILKKAEGYTRQTLSEAKTLIEASQQPINILHRLEMLFENYQNNSFNIDFIHHGTFDNIDREATGTLYKICMEALTNSLRHGKATKVIVILKENSNNITLSIMDNGEGCGNLKLGYGTTKMKERVESLKGNIKFISEEGDGFQIMVELPLKTNIQKNTVCEVS